MNNSGGGVLGAHNEAMKNSMPLVSAQQMTQIWVVD